MNDDRLDAFKRFTMRSQSMPDDLQKLWTMQTSRTPDAPRGADPLIELRARLIEPDIDVPLLYHSYLNESDRADADIMANIAAFDDVFALSTFVVELEDDAILGYWHGPERTPIEEAPILQLDNEGGFNIVRGRNITEAIMACTSWLANEQEFARMRDWFSRYQIAVTGRTRTELERRKAKTDPGIVHHNAYNEHLSAAGLPPIS